MIRRGRDFCRAVPLRRRGKPSLLTSFVIPQQSGGICFSGSAANQKADPFTSLRDDKFERLAEASKWQQRSISSNCRGALY